MQDVFDDRDEWDAFTQGAGFITGEQYARYLGLYFLPRPSSSSASSQSTLSMQAQVAHQTDLSPSTSTIPTIQWLGSPLAPALGTRPSWGCTSTASASLPRYTSPSIPSPPSTPASDTLQPLQAKTPISLGPSPQGTSCQNCMEDTL